MSKRIKGALWALVVLLFAVGIAPAQERTQAEPPPGEIADVWVLWPKAGHSKQFEDAVKQYVAWRKQAGDPFSWNAYQPHVGDDLDFYVFRSGGHHWADLDGLHQWNERSGNSDQYEKLIAPHVARVEHYYSETDYDHSKWEEREDYRYFRVVNLQVRQGAYGEMMEALGKLHKALVDGKWPRSYSINWTHGGDGGMSVVYPYVNFAGMAEPEKPFMTFLSEQLGSEAAARATMKQLQSSFEESRSTIYVHRPDLSTPE